MQAVASESTRCSERVGLQGATLPCLLPSSPPTPQMTVFSRLNCILSGLEGVGTLPNTMRPDLGWESVINHHYPWR